ncbi:hypothetical protein CO610_09055 [Lysobacteraceae bacterium NML95-0200]|nr:hypothetical protein CO610_09055 [Xanthomonadaceae bacterium NML95-0200]
MSGIISRFGCLCGYLCLIGSFGGFRRGFAVFGLFKCCLGLIGFLFCYIFQFDNFFFQCKNIAVSVYDCIFRWRFFCSFIRIYLGIFWAWLDNEECNNSKAGNGNAAQH